MTYRAFKQLAIFDWALRLSRVIKNSVFHRQKTLCSVVRTFAACNMPTQNIHSSKKLKKQRRAQQKTTFITVVTFSHQCLTRTGRLESHSQWSARPMSPDCRLWRHSPQKSAIRFQDVTFWGATFFCRWNFTRQSHPADCTFREGRLISLWCNLVPCQCQEVCGIENVDLHAFETISLFLAEKETDEETSGTVLPHAWQFMRRVVEDCS